MLVAMARRRLDPHKLVLSLGFAIGLVLVIFAFTSARTGDDTPHIDNPAIQALIPNPGDLVLRQSQVGIDLAPGYTGQLVIDSQALPTQTVVAAQPPPGQTVAPILNVRFDPGDNTLLYQPQDVQGAPIREFAAGKHTITARFWKLDEGEGAAQQYTWSFQVV
jgi:hypothetical protein